MISRAFRSPLALAALAALLAAIWYGASQSTSDAARRVLAAHDALRASFARVPLYEDEARAPSGTYESTGLIGVEWSDMTTTLGLREAKRTACSPLWADRFGEWLDAAGASERVAILSSSSFPGMLVAALAAAESRGLDVLLVVSLGSSTWGANRPNFAWPAMHAALIDAGVVKTRAAFFTPGGRDERGESFSQEIFESLSRDVERAGSRVVVPSSYSDAVDKKWRAIEGFDPQIVISIGGSHANLGGGESSLAWPPGYISPDADVSQMPDCVARRALASGIPFVNVLNVRRLASEADIPWDAPSFAPRRGPSPIVCVAALVVFFAALAIYRRWSFDDDH